MAIGVTLIIVAVAVIAIWIIIEMKRMKHKIFAIVLIGLIIFSYVSAATIFKGKNIDYKSIKGLEEAATLYFSWLGSVFGNMKSITTNAVKMDWGAENNSTRSG